MRSLVVLTCWSAVACAAPSPLAPVAPPVEPAAAPPAARPDAGPATTTAETLPVLDASDAGEGTKLPRAESADASAPATRDPDAIAATLAQARPKLRACYDAARATRPELRGSIALRVVVDPKGKVAEASIDDAASEMHDAALSKCVVDVLRATTFPPHDKGKESRLRQSLVFTPNGK